MAVPRNSAARIYRSSNGVRCDALCEARDDDSRFDLLDRGLVAGLLRKRAWRFDFALVALPNERKTSTNGGTLAPALSIKALVS